MRYYALMPVDTNYAQYYARIMYVSQSLGQAAIKVFIKNPLLKVYFSGVKVITQCIYIITMHTYYVSIQT